MKKNFFKKMWPTVSGYIVGAVVAGAVIRFGFHESMKYTIAIVVMTAVVMAIANAVFSLIQSK